MARKNKTTNIHLNFIKLAFQNASINLGNTGTNPSVGCILEKNGSVISSAFTSKNGRPHAETNALNKKINFKNSNMYVTLEPCSHFGLTPPCVNKIIKKGVKKVFISIKDPDKRIKKNTQNIFKKNNIFFKYGVGKKFGENFYESYLKKHSSEVPLIDAKIAISKDYYTKNNKTPFITNIHSRVRAQYLRTKYNCLVTTSKTINDDNPLLNCRIPGLEDKAPDLIIIDRYLKIKKHSKILNTKFKRKIKLFTLTKNIKKINFLKSKGIKVYIIKSLDNYSDFKYFLIKLKKIGYERVFIETGLSFLNYLFEGKFINNLYVFKSNKKIKKNTIDLNNNQFIKKIKLNEKNRVKVFLKNDNLFKVRIN